MEALRKVLSKFAASVGNKIQVLGNSLRITVIKSFKSLSKEQLFGLERLCKESDYTVHDENEADAASDEDLPEFLHFIAKAAARIDGPLTVESLKNYIATKQKP